ncbi:MAG: DUF86 domain-containing protein [Anaerolineae bacterium]|nr:DUF86 domain-containing protein [Anaerolineae bacterium]
MILIRPWVSLSHSRRARDWGITRLQLLARISDYQRIIGFRNVLAHGYDVVSDETVWDIVENRLDLLAREVSEIKLDAGMA